jgi:charged multivesicular body protein 6
LERNLDTTDKQLFNLEEMVSNLEYKQVELKVIEGLKLGNESLKNINKLLNIDDIEKIMDETKESIEYQQEINQLLSGQFTQEDDELIENELDNILGIKREMDLPNVPQHSIEIEQQTIKKSIKETKKKQTELAD